MGSVHAARSPDCKLELVTVSPSDMAPGAKFGGGEYELVGSVMIGADKGTDAMSEEMRRLVRPRVCAMGGEVISLLASGTGVNRRGHGQQNIGFTVWAHRTAQPATPVAF